MRSESEYREIIEEALEPQLRSLGHIPGKLMEAMLYSLTAGGKRMRPVMLLAACEMAGGNLETALPFACALEMIHTYSLIHDDLPGMDNDDMRRGRPTNHRVFGEGMAILAGDGLLNGAMEIALRAAVQMGNMRGISAAEILARHAGVTGMIAGQTMDLTMEGEPPTEETVSYIHKHKTADLLEAPVEMGLLLAGCNPELIEKGRQFAEHLGIAFQIQDDILDVIGDAGLMGKNTGMDSRKMTWVALKGLEGAKQDAVRQTEMAVAALKQLPWDISYFEDLAWNNVSRKK